MVSVKSQKVAEGFENSVEISDEGNLQEMLSAIMALFTAVKGQNEEMWWTLAEATCEYLDNESRKNVDEAIKALGERMN